MSGINRWLMLIMGILNSFVNRVYKLGVAPSVSHYFKKACSLFIILQATQATVPWFQWLRRSFLLAFSCAL